MATDHFCLKWNNFHNSIVSAFESLQSSEDLVDVTLMCEGRNVKAHKVILSACSPYFRNLFKETPCQHPIIILKDVLHCDLIAILQFMYQGEVLITQDGLASFLKTAELLQVSGLAGNTPPGATTTIQENVVIPAQNTQPAPPLVPIPTGSPASPRPTINKHHSEVSCTKQPEKENASKKEEKIPARFDPEIEPIQSCSYQQTETVVIKTESNDQEFDDMDYSMISDENLDDPGPATEEQSILERSLKAQEWLPDNAQECVTKDEFYHNLSFYYDSKPWTNARISEVINLIREFNADHFKQKQSKHFYYAKKYDFMEIEGQEILIVKPKSAYHPKIRVVPIEEYYDRLIYYHVSTGHGGRDKILHTIKNKEQIPRRAVEIFLKLCRVCISKKALH